MKYKSSLPAILAGIGLSLCSIGCAGGDRDKNGKEDNLDRKNMKKVLTQPDNTRTTETEENMEKDTTRMEPILPPK